MDKTDRLRDYGLAFLLYEQGLGVCGYELIRELFIFVKLILNSYLASNFDNGINPVVSRDTGEKLVSEVSRRTLVEDYSYWNMPIAELFKQKVDGNPGFDFHTVTPDGTLLMFGEAKYVANTNAYNSAFNQIPDFIKEGKDMKDLFEIRDFMPSPTPLDNANNGIKGYVAAFSTNKTDDKDIISKVTGHKNYAQLSQYPQFIAIAVDL